MKRKIIDYMIINSDTISYLKDQVWELLETGWQPMGGIVCRQVSPNGQNELMQVMVKYESKKREDGLPL